MKKFLTIASIFSGISILFYFLIGAYIPMFIEVGITMFYLYLGNGTVTKSNKTILLVSAIINLSFNFISSILAFVAYSESDKEIKVLTEEEKKQRKILTILNVGTFMVILSGFIFVTTSKDDFSDFMKTLFLFFGSILFVFLYIFTKKQLHMTFSCKVYYLISLVFLGFTYYSLGNFELLGSYFSVHGEGSNLFLASNFIIDAILCSLLYKEYSNRTILYIIYSFLVLSIFNFMSVLHLDYFYMITAFTLILSMIHFVKTSKDTLCYGYGLLLFLICISIMNIENANPVFLTILTILQIFNLIIYSKRLDSSFSKASSIIMGIACILNFGLRVIIDFNLFVSILIPCLSLFYIVIFINKLFFKDKNFSTFVMVLMNFIFLIFYLISISLNITTFLIVALSIMLTNMIYLMYTKEKTLEYYLDPFKKIIFISTCLYAISCYQHLSVNLSLSILVLLMFVFFTFIKEHTLKNLYFGILIYLILLSSFINLFKFDFLAMSIFILSIIGLFLSTEKEERYKSFRIPFYIFMHFMIYYYFINIPLFKRFFIGYILVFCIYSLIMWLYKNKRKYFVITSYLMTLPMFGLVTSNIQNNDITIIVMNLIGFYFLWITNKNFIKKDVDKIVITDMVTIALLSMVIFTDSILLSVYGGIVSFILLSIGFSYKKYEHLFTISIVATIINIVVSFKELWLSFSLWFYLLIIGIFMIVFATYREIKK